jgi:hypothetical protein
MDPIVNKNYRNSRYLSDELNSLNAIPHRKMKQYSKGLKADQIFRCPKDSRSKRRKCCGGNKIHHHKSFTFAYLSSVYYELFDDAWRILEGWFTME